MAVVPSGTVTFLFTDLEDSTRLWDEDPGAMKPALARHDAILRDAIGRRDGSVVKATGDGFLAVFPSATEAVGAALVAQLQLLAEPWDSSGGLRVRMGIHTGEAESRDGDYFGGAVNRAARLMSLAHGSQVLLSLATEELTREALPSGCGLRDLGEYELRGLARRERVFQLTHPELPSEFPALESLERVHGNLPQRLTSFIGRSSELAELDALIDGARLLSLNGVGGCGKTRLALELADRRAEAFGGGTWLVELGPVADGDRVVIATAAALGERDLGGDVVSIIADRIGASATLIVFDNCEHLLGAVADLVEELLHRCAHLVVLATSREPLGVPGETTWRVPSLQVPEASSDLNVLVESEAVALFADRATRSRADFVLDEHNVVTVGDICRRLDGVPLAIELAAARVHALTVEQIASGLDQRFRLLTGRQRSALPRQRTLQASVDWSYQLLSPIEQDAFDRLSVFAGSFRLDAAVHVLADNNTQSEFDVVDIVSDLVAKSMIDAGVSGRYRLLETLRDYGARRLEERDLSSEARNRHLAWASSLHDPVEHAVGGRPDHLPGLGPELGELLAALDWALISEQPDSALIVADALLCDFNVIGAVDGPSAMRGGEAALAMEGGNPALRALVAANLTHAAFDVGSFEIAAGLHDAMLDEARSLGDPGILAFVLYEASRSGIDLNEGLALADEAHQLARVHSLPGLIGRSLTYPVAIAGYSGNRGRTQELADEILADDDAGPDATGTALWALANVERATGHLEKAREHLREHERRGLMELFGSPRIQAMHVSFLTLLDIAQGIDTGAAARVPPLLAEARRRDLGLAIFASGWLPVAWALAHNRIDDAMTELHAWMNELEGMPITSFDEGVSVRTFLAAGDPAGARAIAAAAPVVGPGYDLGITVTRLEYLNGIIAATEGNTPEGRALVRHALHTQQEQGWRPDVTHSLEALAVMCINEDDATDGVRLAGAAQTQRDRMGYALRWPSENTDLQAGLDAARIELSSAFTVAFDEGRALSIDAAVDLASESRS